MRWRWGTGNLISSFILTPNPQVALLDCSLVPTPGSHLAAAALYLALLVLQPEVVPRPAIILLLVITPSRPLDCGAPP